MRTDSLMIRIKAKVANTWDKWSRAYSVRSKVASSSMPTTAVSMTANTTPSQNDWVN